MSTVEGFVVEDWTKWWGEIAFPLCAIRGLRWSVRIGVCSSSEVRLCFLENCTQCTGVLDIPISVKLSPDGQCPCFPQIPPNSPVQLICEVTPVERPDILSVCG